MPKYWALIGTSRIHVFSLGNLKDEEEACKIADEFCERKNAENDKKIKELQSKGVLVDSDTRPEYQFIWLLDESDIRTLTGEVHRPYTITREKQSVGVETPVIHTATQSSVVGP